MEFSPQQDDALKAVARWLKAGRPQIFRLFGYAGTGKTTLARYFAEHVDGQVQFAAFTGKAAQVLRSKGAVNARTIHSLIYRPRGEEAVADEATGKTSMSPTFSLNRQSPIARAKLVIVDECSMVDEQLGRDLHVVSARRSWCSAIPGNCRRSPAAASSPSTSRTILLTEIHRQARDNPIIRLALDVREGREFMRGDYGAAQVIGKEDVTQELVLKADQVLVGTNRTRRRYNQRLRELKGFTADYPQAGDKLVCLRNDPGQGPAQRLALEGHDLVARDGEARHQPAGLAGRGRSGSRRRQDQAAEGGLRGSRRRNSLAAAASASTISITATR